LEKIPEPGNTVAAHWAQKLENRKAHRNGILDTGATSGVAPADDEEYFDDTGQKSSKIFMLPDKQQHKATKKMLLWQPLRESAREMNIVPGLHSTLISVPKLADANYTTVFEKGKATIYDALMTTITADQPPILDAPRCKLTGLWELSLEPLQTTSSDTRSAATQPKAINVIFDLPSTCQTLLWYHAAAVFSHKRDIQKHGLCRQLFHMAGPHRQNDPPPLPQFQQNR
jgi:hypothetical protein